MAISDYAYLAARYAERERTTRAEAARLDRQIARLTAKRQAVAPPSWVDEIVRPLGLQVQIALGDHREFKRLGPYGLGARVILCFYKTCIPYSERNKGDNCRSITLEPGDLSLGELRWVDTSVDTGRYAPDTLGAANDLNHPAAPIPADAPIGWFLERLT